MPTNTLEIFSAGYFITTKKLRITGVNRETARVTPELYDELQVEGGPVVVKAKGTHWEVEPSPDVMYDTLEVPVTGADEEKAILVARPGRAEQIFRW